jgi:hypothetical protein
MIALVRGSRLGAIACAGVLALAPSVAVATRLASPPAAAPPVDLRWEAPRDCPDRSKIEADVARFLAHGARSEDAPVVIDARVTKEGGRFVLALSVHASAGALDKTMRADDCKVLASAVALVVAVLLDPTAVVETVERERVAPPPPEPEPAPAPKPAPAPAPKRKLDVQGLLRPFVAGSFGPLPRFGVATGGIVGAQIGPGRIEVHAIWDAPQRARADTVDAGARLDLWAVGPRGCYAPRWRTLQVPVCAGGEVGQIRGRGFGLSVSRRARATWAAVTGGAALLWVPLRWIAVGGGVDAVVALTRPSFVIDDVGRVHRPRAAGVRIHAGLEVRFP